MVKKKERARDALAVMHSPPSSPLRIVGAGQSGLCSHLELSGQVSQRGRHLSAIVAVNVENGTATSVSNSKFSQEMGRRERRTHHQSSSSPAY
jgi:hypothetical protein